MASILEKNYNFTVDSVANGPWIATVIAIEMIIALVINLFITIFTLCNPKILKNPSIIFLTNFVVTNIFLVIAYMPSIVITASAGEWILGDTPEQKNGTCQLMGFIYLYSYYIITFTLTLISIDRFLFIVKPHLHKRFMKTWVAVILILAVSLLSLVLCTFNVVGIGSYEFEIFTAACIPQWPENVAYLTLILMVLFSCVAIIIVTTLWTFCFTRNFLKRTKDRTTATSTNSPGQNLYNRRIRRIIGMFSMILIATIITYAPLILVSILGVTIGFQNVPTDLGIVILTFFLSNTITNPLIQSYFRKELNDYVIMKCQHVRKLLFSNKLSGRKVDSTADTNSASMMETGFGE